jgi:hypothetical protein
MPQAWASRPYVISLEIGLRSPGGRLQELLDWLRSSGAPTIGLGFFAALGDLDPDDHEPTLYAFLCSS